MATSEPLAPSTSSDEVRRNTGAVRNLKGGFGFIAGDDGRDYFFHWSAMEKTTKNFRELVVQERVSFSVEKSERGPRAVLIRVIE